MRERLGRAAAEAACLVLVAAVLGLVANQFSSRAVPLRGSPARSIPVVSTLALAQAKAIHDAGSMLFVDGRDRASYASGHVPGAVNLPAGDLEEALASEKSRMDAARGFVIYCEQPDGAVAKQVGRQMSAHGLGNLYLFPGGWRDWSAAGLPIQRGGAP